jgi:hypothetical protein
MRENAPVTQSASLLGSRYASAEMRKIFAPESKIIQERKLWIAVMRAQSTLGHAIDAKVKQAQRDSKLVVLLKNDDKASYRNVIDVMDEFMICQIAKYFAVDEGMAPLEKKLIDQQPKS